MRLRTHNALGGPLPDPSKEIHYGKFPLAGAQIYTRTLSLLPQRLFSRLRFQDRS